MELNWSELKYFIKTLYTLCALANFPTVNFFDTPCSQFGSAES